MKQEAIERKGLLLVISGPSGAGKTTVCHELLARVQGLRPSISWTTRRPRAGEVNGREYFFTETALFQDMARRDEFAEWARVYGNFYGTPRKPLSEMVDQGIDVLLEIDVQGAIQIKKKFPDAVTVYLLPPSIAELQARLVRRASDTADEISRRLLQARDEIRHYRDYDYIVRNQELEEAVKSTEAIVLAERLKTTRMNVAKIEECVARELEKTIGLEAEEAAGSAQKRGVRT